MNYQNFKTLFHRCSDWHGSTIYRSICPWCGCPRIRGSTFPHNPLTLRVPVTIGHRLPCRAPHIMTLTFKVITVKPEVANICSCTYMYVHVIWLPYIFSVETYKTMLNHTSTMILILMPFVSFNWFNRTTHCNCLYISKMYEETPKQFSYNIYHHMS